MKISAMNISNMTSEQRRAYLRGETPRTFHTRASVYGKHTNFPTLPVDPYTASQACHAKGSGDAFSAGAK